MNTARPDHDISLYKLIDGEWKLKFDYKVPDVCQKCGGSFRPSLSGYNLMNILEQGDPTAGANWCSPVVCSRCKQEYERAFWAHLDDVNPDRMF